MTGTSAIPSWRAASSRAWPAITSLSAPTSTGFVQPNSLMDAAIWATCSGVCVRGFVIRGISRVNRPCFYFDVDSDFHNSTHLPFASVVRCRPVMPDPVRVLLLRVHRLIHRNATRLGNLGHRLPRLGQDRLLARQLRNPAQGNVAVRRRNLAAVSQAPQDVGCGDRSGASQEGIKNKITFVRERFDEELRQRTWEWCGVRALAALGLDFDHIGRARNAGEAAIAVAGARLPRCRSACAGAEQTTAGCGLRIIRRVIEAVLRDVADRRWAKLDASLRRREVKQRFPGVLEAIPPPARYAVIRLPPAQFVDEPPAPLAHVRDQQVLHV